MKIKKSQLKQIIKEEISNVLVEFDLDSELASIDTGVASVNKKKTHRDIGHGLMQASTALNLMLQLSIEVRNKKSRFFAEQMPHGPALKYFKQIEQLAKVLSTVSKQVSDQGQSLEENYKESELARENENMKELINHIKNLGIEMKQVGFGGMTPDEKEVDNLILAKLKLSIGTFDEIVKNHIYAILEQFRDLSGEKLVPERLRNYLDNAPTSEVFAPMRQKA